MGKSALPTFSVSTLLAVVGLFAVSFAMFRAVPAVGAIMVGATVAGVVSVAIACVRCRKTRQPVRLLSLFCVASLATIVLQAWWGSIGWTAGAVGEVVADSGGLGLAGGILGITGGALCGLLIAVDMGLRSASPQRDKLSPQPAHPEKEQTRRGSKMGEIQDANDGGR